MDGVSGEVRGMLDDRIEETGLAVAAALRALCEEVAGRECRPRDLMRKLGLDKSTAGRIGKAVRAGAGAGTGVDVLIESPSPLGLGKAIAAAEAKGLPPACVEGLRSARAGYEALQASVPGGQADFDVVLAGMQPDGKERRLAASQREMHKAMAMLQGCRVEHHQVQTWYIPNRERSSRLDYLWSSSMLGLRRLRDTDPLFLGGVHDPEDPTTAARRLDIDGRPLGSDLRRWVVPELSTIDRDRLDLWSSPPTTMLLMGTGVVPLGAYQDLVMATWTPDGLDRYRNDGDPYAQSMVMTRLPAKLLTIDYMVHRSLGFGGPRCRPALSMLPAGTYTRDPERPSPDVSSLRHILDPIEGGGAAAAGGIGNHGKAIADRFSAATGHGLDEFKAWRLEVRHPVPMVTMHVWFEKPEAGSASKAG